MGYLLYGQNALLLDERIVNLRHEIDPGNLSTSIIDVQHSDAAEIRAAAQAIPFFGGRRLVILLNPIASPRRSAAVEDPSETDASGRIKWADLVDVLKTAPATTTFILRHDGSLTQTHYAYKTARSLAWSIESFQVKYGPELLAWVQERARRSGADIEPQAATELLDLLYPTSWQSAGRFATDTPDLRLVATEIEKLSTATDTGMITRDIVRELVADRSGYTAFRLNDVLFSGQTNAALLELFNVLESGEPAERVISQIAGEASALASARASSDLPPKAVADASGVSEARLARLRDRAAGLDAEGHRLVSEAIRHADTGVKTGQIAETSATITPLVAEIAEVVRASKKPGRRR